MIHDFCGGLEEELMRTNFILVYELIDEMIVRYTHLQCLGLWSPADNISRYTEKICSHLSREMLHWNYVDII